MGKPGDIYQPSNGTEGVAFVSEFCDNCIHEKFNHTYKEGDKKCDIFSRSLLHDTIEEGYPTEWTYDEEGSPTCTAHVKWDWGNGDPDDPDNPKAPPPPTPANQLDMFPLEVSDGVKEYGDLVDRVTKEASKLIGIPKN